MSFGSIDRRRFLSHSAAGLGALAAGLTGCDDRADPGAENAPVPPPPADPLPERKPYEGPTVILIRFGGGVRRLETIQDAAHTYCPFLYHELAGKRGVLFNNLVMDTGPNVVTSHGQGTLYLLTGRYDKYEDISHKPFSERFEAKVPTVFEYLRKYYQVTAEQCLIINGEDRIGEEFYTFSNHHAYGVNYRSTVMSLYRFKTYLKRKHLLESKGSDREWEKDRQELVKMLSQDYRRKGLYKLETRKDIEDLHLPLEDFWTRWEQYYGKTGFVNPRGDRLLTTLTLWALKELKPRPRLLMINYQDPDYVHWGPPSFYTRGISTIDEGIREIYHAVQADEEYRDNTVFVVVPDCGRDNNRCMEVPYQHHFNSKSSHEIFAVLAGPKKFVPNAPRIYPGKQQQIAVTPTIGELMGIPMPHVDADSLLKVV
jgi:hypothetical protein